MLMWIVMLGVLVIGAVLAFLLFSKRPAPEEEAPAYVCKECGESHCNCYLEEETR